MNEFVFCEKTKNGRINTTQETLLVVVLLSDHFIKDDPSKIPFFFQVFELGKNSRKFLLLKFILTGIAIQSRPVSLVDIREGISNRCIQRFIYLGSQRSWDFSARPNNKRFPHRR